MRSFFRMGASAKVFQWYLFQERGMESRKGNLGTCMKTLIKEYRARAGMTQADLADAVGVRRETIVFLEKGTYNPSLKLAHDVARSAWHEDRYPVYFR